MSHETKQPDESAQSDQLQDLPESQADGQEADAVKGGGAIIEERSLSTTSVPLADVSVRMGAQPHL